MIAQSLVWILNWLSKLDMYWNTEYLKLIADDEGRSVRVSSIF